MFEGMAHQQPHPVCQSCRRGRGERGQAERQGGWDGAGGRGGGGSTARLTAKFIPVLFVGGREDEGGHS